MITETQKALEGATALARLLRDAAKENLGEKLEATLLRAASEEQAIREREGKIADLDAAAAQKLSDLQTIKAQIAEQSDRLAALNSAVMKAVADRDVAVKAYESFLKSLPK